MSVHRLMLTPPRRSFGERARAIVRLNGFASIVWALLMFAIVVPLADRVGMTRLGSVLLGAAILLIGGGEVLLSVGRRLRRTHVIPFALLNAASSSFLPARTFFGLPRASLLPQPQ
ncbi:MAG: hypothetical protein E6G46_12275 [Actinobacteria bacterium]|nr:MAG: hypothetical protein E6G46_12275 [Actinomycetota bacterium]